MLAGDGNNMCQSYINAAKILGFHLKIACPEGFEPSSELLDQAQGMQASRTIQSARVKALIY